MTTLAQKQQKLREIINGANPELLRLEFGCEVEIENYITTVIILLDKSGWVRLGNEDHPLDFVGFTGSESIANFDRKHIKQILGKPPTLEHLLTAFGRKQLGIDATGEMIFVGTYDKRGRVQIDYDLSKSPLDQSEQVIDSLLEILN